MELGTKIVLSSMFYDEIPKNEPEKSSRGVNKLEIAVPRLFLSTDRYDITPQLKLEVAVPPPLSSTYR